MTDNTDSPASNQTHVTIEEYVHLQKKYLESVLTEQSFMIEIKELLDKSIEANSRIAELEAALRELREAARGVDQDEMHYSQRDEWGHCLTKADEALKGEK
jgi:hypothetical protein